MTKKEILLIPKKESARKISKELKMQKSANYKKESATQKNIRVYKIHVLDKRRTPLGKNLKGVLLYMMGGGNFLFYAYNNRILFSKIKLFLEFL
ncbi:MAG: hypothetical protein J6P03_01220 [Opitutales bacterium]|nr:hypothetical protein [Opitutales bacterium]